MRRVVMAPTTRPYSMAPAELVECACTARSLGSGIAPILALRAAGVPISMGVDGAASNEAADMIPEVHAAWLMQRAAAGERSLPKYRGGNGEDENTAVSTDDVVAWGTSGGAKVLGLDAIDTLAPGMAADIALYALDNPRYFGLHDVAVGPVASGGRPTLKGLWVNGQQVVADDVLRGVNVGELRAEARGAVRRLMAA